MEDRLILIDYNDKEIGEGLKTEVHQKGLLHRAFSIFIFNKDKLLIQRRADGKYHSAGLWANTCCSHPRVNEDIMDAARRRLIEEAGIDTDLKEVGSFIYHEKFNDNLYEYECDHVFIGEYNGDYLMNEDEASEMKYVDIGELKEDMIKNPDRYCVWFFTALDIALKHYNK